MRRTRIGNSLAYEGVSHGVSCARYDDGSQSIGQNITCTFGPGSEDHKRAEREYPEGYLGTIDDLVKKEILTIGPRPIPGNTHISSEYQDEITPE